MSLRLGTVAHPDGGLRLGGVQWQSLDAGGGTGNATWDGNAALWGTDAIAWGSSYVAVTARVELIPEAGGAVGLRVTFPAVVYGSLGLSLALTGGAVGLTYYGGQGTTRLTYLLSRRVYSNETGTITYSDTSGDLAGSDGVPLGSFSTAVSIIGDTNPPVLLSASVSAGGEVVALAFDEPVLSSASPMNWSGFAIEASAGLVTMVYDSGSGSRSVLFELSRPIGASEQVRITYSGTLVVDLDGNALRPCALFAQNGSTVSDATFDADKKGAFAGSWWSSVTVPSGAINAGGALTPDFDTDSGCLLFSPDLPGKIIVWLQLPPGWTEGSAVYPLVRWAKITEGAGNVAWQLRYRHANIGEGLTEWSEAAIFTQPETVDDNSAEVVHVTQLERISVPAGRIGMVLGLEITRISDQAQDTYADDVRLFDVSLAYQSNQAGSQSLFTKYAAERSF